MPIENGEYVKLTEDQIYQRLETNLEDLLDTSAEPGDLVTKQLDAEAKTLAQFHEQSLQRIYEAAYLRDATGENLDKLVELIGLSREEAVPAGGTVRFWRETPPTADYVIPRGTKVQTPGNDPISFVTTEQSAIRFIDGFEDNDLNGWEGDTGSVSVVSSNEMTGNYVLSLPATQDVGINTIEDYEIGTIFGIDIQATAGTTTAVRFGRKDSDNYYEAEIDVGANDLRIREIVNGAEDRSSTENVTISAGDTVHLAVKWSLYGDHWAKLYDSSNRSTTKETAFLEDNSEPSRKEGGFGVYSKDSTDSTLVDDVTTSATTVNIEAEEGGVQTNVSANAIQTIADSLSGIERVSNPVPTGDPSYLNTNFSEFVTGREREGDEELRDRALDNSALGGSATVEAIGTKLRRVSGVESVKLFYNKEETTQDGLPPHSFEAVVYGGKDSEIAHALFDVKAIDSTDVGGVHGTESTYTVSSEFTGQNETLHWSTPTEVNLNITVDLIVDGSYIGDDEIKSNIVQYVGGTDIDGSFTPGIGPGENVYEAVLSHHVVDPEETGVWEVDSISIDSDNDGNDNTTTLASGADVLEIQDGEIAQSSAQDDSITINTTSK